MTSTYLIGSKGGGSHSFIAWLLFHLIPEHQYQLTWETPGTANAHKFVEAYYNKFILGGFYGSHQPISIKKLHNPDDNVPLIIFGPPVKYNDFAILEERYPKFRYINIQFTERDVLQLEINHFFKMNRFQSPSLLDIDEYWLLYKKECGVNSDIRSGLTHLNQLTIEESWILIDKQLSLRPAHAVNTPVPSDFSQMSCTILFSEIVNNKNKVLETLSSFVSGNITPRIIEQYEKYINLQIEFNNKYYPK